VHAVGTETRGLSWEEVYRCVDERRLDLSMSKAELYRRAQLSETTIEGMGRGVPIARTENRGKLAAALGWTADSIDLILAGQAPEVIQPDDAAEKQRRLEQRIAELEARLDRLEPRGHPTNGSDA
jgi:hypothetical protein